MFSGALQTYYYHSKDDMLDASLKGEADPGKRDKDGSDDADDEEEDLEQWNPPKKGTKRGLMLDRKAAQTGTRTAADDEYEHENDFTNISEMIETAQLEGQSLSLSTAERRDLQIAESPVTDQVDIDASKRTESAYSAASSVPATPGATSKLTNNPATPFTPNSDGSVSTPVTVLGNTSSSLNQVWE